MSKRRKNLLRFTHVHMENWRNFTSVDVDLQYRVFLVGPNASGKSNLLDVFRFLHAIASVGGGFLGALSGRGGFGKLKSLMAPHHADVAIRVCVGDDKSPRQWEYELRFAEEHSLPKITSERVVKQGKELLRRPSREDNGDPPRLRQTYVEQASANQGFRELADFFAAVRYVQLVPQVLRSLILAPGSDNPYGGSLLRQMAELPDNVRDARLVIIRAALQAAVPQLQELEFWTDPAEQRPHLRAKYAGLEGTWQQEDQFSDGTLRLIGMLWALLDGDGTLLLEEPELFLHPAIIRYLPGIFARLGDRERRQVILSTHSPDLLRDEGIGLDEILLLEPRPGGTKVGAAKGVDQISTLVTAGVSLDEAVLPYTSPPQAQGMVLSGK